MSACYSLFIEPGLHQQHARPAFFPERDLDSLAQILSGEEQQLNNGLDIK
jgi:hypothetical protein